MRLSAILQALAAAALLGCNPGSTTSSPPSATCTESGVQCQLQEGPLGVCEQSHCRVGEAPPCYRCIPQH